MLTVLENATSGENSVGTEFRWGPAKRTVIRLTWNARRLRERGVKTVEVVYTQAENLDKLASRLVSVGSGKVVIGGLRPDTLYSVEAIGLGVDNVVLTHGALIRTLPKSKFSDCIHCNSLHVCAEISIAKLDFVSFPVLLFCSHVPCSAFGMDTSECLTECTNIFSCFPRT